jgi:hypothetical protein
MPKMTFLVSCWKCRRGFWLPWSRSFDPCIPEQVDLSADKWCKCPHCELRFVFRRKYEQCPGCGKILIGNDAPHSFDLKDNSAAAFREIEAAKALRGKPWWRLW